MSVTVNKLDYIYKKLLHDAKSKMNDTVEISNEEYENIFGNNDEPIIDPSEEDDHDYSQDYLTFEALEDNCKINFFGNFIKEIKYSLNNDLTWNTLYDNEFIILNKNEIVYFYNENDLALYDENTMDPTYGYCHFYSENKFNVYGNILSLYNFNKNLLGRIFSGLFKNCINLIDASNLVLPATTLAVSCYQNMFNGCTSLTTAPEILPATTLATYCYREMFYGCTSLTTVPKLPATNLANYCYMYMFYGCTSLTTTPELSATNLTNYCYQGMFSGCTSLTTAPEILPATTLINGCYASMFQDCTSLTIASELPATILADQCYASMFSGCISLKVTPELPAIALTTSCYDSMFFGCTSLTTASELPATVLVTYCYYQMFYGCTSLNYIKCLATDISASNCTFGWIYGVSRIGTFIKSDNMNNWTTGISGIPAGWEVINEVIPKE